MRASLRAVGQGLAAAAWLATAWPDARAAESAETPAAHHAAGMENLRAGRVAEALSEFRAAVRLDRNFLPSLLQMADLLSAGDRVFEAYGILQHAVDVAPGSAEAHALLGRCFSRLRNAKDARRELLRALELNPSLTEPTYGLAAAELRLGRLAEARRHVDAYLEAATDDDAAKELRATICLEMRDFDCALAGFQDVGSRHADDPSYGRAVARTLLEAGRYQDAEQAFRAVLARDPADREALHGAYDSAYKRGAYAEATDALEQLAKMEPASCQPLLLLSRSYYRLDRFSEARERASRCVRIEPGHSGALFLIGWTWLGEGELDKAKAEFEQALVGDPNSVEALYWLATVELRLGNRAAALGRLEKAVAVDTEHTSAHYELARIYAAEGRAALASKQFDEFRRLKARESWKAATERGGSTTPGPSAPADASHLEDWIGFANFLVEEKKPREALQVLAQADKAGPGNAEVMVLAAAAHTEAGEIDEALAAYAEAERRGGTALLYWGRGMLQHRLEDDAAALVDLRRALSMELPARQAAQAHSVAGAILSRQRRWQEAEAELRRAIALDPDGATAHLLLAEALIETGRPADAARETAHSLDEDPNDAAARLTLARALLDQKRFDDAAGEIARAAGIEGESARVLAARGRLAVAQGRGLQAIEHFSRASQADPSQAEVFHLLGLQLIEAARTSEAAVAFEKATIVDPGAATSWIALGRIYLGARRAPAAAGYFEKAVAAAPDDAEGHYQLAVALNQAGHVSEAREAAQRAKVLGHPEAEALLQSLAASNP